MGDREALPTGDRSHLGAFHIRFPFGKTLTVNVFRQRINQLFEWGGDIWRAIAKHSLWAIAKQFQWAIAQHSLWEIAFRVPRVSSQGKILKVLINDCAALPLGDREALATKLKVSHNIY